MRRARGPPPHPICPPVGGGSLPPPAAKTKHPPPAFPASGGLCLSGSGSARGRLGLRRRRRRGLRGTCRGSLGSLGRRDLVDRRRRVDELDDRHLRAVAAARPELRRAGVAARTTLEALAEIDHQL